MKAQLVRGNVLPAILAAAISLGAASGLAATEVRGLEVRGARRTHVEWIQDYISIEFPAEIPESDLVRIRQKLMTADVFVDVKVHVDAETSNLVIDLEEKWTTIPVIRGAYGGGTPLLVIGAYDTHAFGSLVTVGAETKKYGDAEPGFTLWAKLPRAGKGKSSAGVELWRDHRRRDYYDAKGNQTGSLDFDSAYARLYHLAPLFSDDDPLDPRILQAGIEILLRLDRAPSIEGKPDVTMNLPRDTAGRGGGDASEQRILASVVFDNMGVEDQLLQGQRVLLKTGYSRSSGVKDPGLSRYSEAEFFSFHRPFDSWNLVVHGYAQGAGSPTASNVFHLGGFDSVRGFPDGIRYGAFGAYGNLELRQEALASKSLKLAGVVFADAGIAGRDFDDAREDIFRSVGAGVRVSFPKVHRLVFRMDYAWGDSNQISTSGISIGLNQFFQPYKPL
jgi:hypothetical protein